MKCKPADIQILIKLSSVAHRSPWSNHFNFTSDPWWTERIHAERAGNPRLFLPLSPFVFLFPLWSFMSFHSFCVSFPVPVISKRCRRICRSVLVPSACLPICPSVPSSVWLSGVVSATDQSFVVPVKIPSDVKQPGYTNPCFYKKIPCMLWHLKGFSSSWWSCCIHRVCTTNQISSCGIFMERHQYFASSCNERQKKKGGG